MSSRQIGAPALATHAVALVTTDIPIWSIIRSTLPLEPHHHLPLALWLFFHKTVGKCRSFLTLYASRRCTMVTWPVSLVTAGCYTHPKHAGDSGMELQNHLTEHTGLLFPYLFRLLTWFWLIEPEPFISFGEWFRSGILLVVALLQCVSHFTLTSHQATCLLWLECWFSETYGSHRSLGHG